MIFGDVPLDRAAGAILAHSVRLPEGRLRKGVVLGDAEVARLRDAGIDHVTVARLTGTDMDENEAATRIGSALLADGLELRPAFTGRANLHATQAGVFEVSRQRIDALNLCDPDITVATLPEWQRVAAGMMVATVKIIPYAADFAVFGPHLDAARGALRLHPPAIDRAELIVTKLTGAPTGVKAVLSRLDRLGVAHSGRPEGCPGDRPAGMRAVARAQWCGLGAGAGDLRGARHVRRYRWHGGRWPVERNSDAPATPRQGKPLMLSHHAGHRRSAACDGVL